jgi:ATP-dependent exoDNAse (exonuclease V) alpha subunit
LKILPIVELDKVHRFVEGKNKVSVIRKSSFYEILSTTLSLAGYLNKNRDDFQVITPIKYSMVGAYNLNRHLQSKLNPNGRAINGGKFKIGDRVIVIKNCYNK